MTPRPDAGNPSPQVVVRPARPHEEEHAAALVRETYAAFAADLGPAWPRYRDAIEAALTSTNHVQRLIALRGHRLIGTAALYPAGRSSYSTADVTPSALPEMRLLAVAAAARGHGVGKLLTLDCLRRSLAAGASGLGLHTMEPMKSAARLYIKLGFVRDLATDFHIPGPTPILVKGYVIRAAAAQAALRKHPTGL